MVYNKMLAFVYGMACDYQESPIMTLFFFSTRSLKLIPVVKDMEENFNKKADHLESTT